MLIVECQLSNEKWKLSNENKVKPFVGVYLRSFSSLYFTSLVLVLQICDDLCCSKNLKSNVTSLALAHKVTLVHLWTLCFSEGALIPKTFKQGPSFDLYLHLDFGVPDSFTSYEFTYFVIPGEKSIPHIVYNLQRVTFCNSHLNQLNCVDLDYFTLECTQWCVFACSMSGAMCDVQQFAIFCADNLRLQRLDSDGSDSYICPPPPPSL